MKAKSLFIAALGMLASAPMTQAEPMKARVIQPYFALDDGGYVASYQWELQQLQECDETIDLIVLPEFSDVPGKSTNDEFYGQLKSEGETYRRILSETAKRCNAIVCAGCVELTEAGPRNTTFVFDRKGELVGRYIKQQLTRGEWANRGFDKSYELVWNEPTIIEVEGKKLAFLTCYDFYYYENFSNIARYKPDIIIGCSNQRSDPHNILTIINTFCAYNTGAYLVRASVSMGEDSPVGGCSCIVAPTGEILCNLYSRRGVADATFDPSIKYLKPAGYGNPPSMHSEYIEIGRRPVKYRPGGSAIVPFIDEASEQRVAALGGMKLFGKDLMARIGAAVGEGVEEVQVEIKPGDPMTEKVLGKFSCHTILNFKLVGDWNESSLKEFHKRLFDYDVLRHVCITSESTELLGTVKEAMPDVALCLQKPASTLNPDAVAEAHASGFRICTVCRKGQVQKLFGKGVDTAVVRNY